MKNLDIRIGDYVETKDGNYGYVTEVTNSAIAWYCKTDNYFYWFKDNLSVYARIGKYDFTKKDKIKPLNCYAYIKVDSENKKSFYCESTLSEIINKINEIIDYINKEE